MGDHALISPGVLARVHSLLNARDVDEEVLMHRALQVLNVGTASRSQRTGSCLTNFGSDFG